MERMLFAMSYNNELQDAIEQYFKQYPIDVEETKIRYKEKNKIQIIDDTVKDSYKLGVENAKLYMEGVKK